MIVFFITVERMRKKRRDNIMTHINAVHYIHTWMHRNTQSHPRRAFCLFLSFFFPSLVCQPRAHWLLLFCISVPYRPLLLLYNQWVAKKLKFNPSKTTETDRCVCVCVLYIVVFEQPPPTLVKFATR